eukprot:1406606-Pleurochrysis_carterae.AAC.1
MRSERSTGIAPKAKASTSLLDEGVSPRGQSRKRARESTFGPKEPGSAHETLGTSTRELATAPPATAPPATAPPATAAPGTARQAGSARSPNPSTGHRGSATPLAFPARPCCLGLSGEGAACVSRLADGGCGVGRCVW